MTSVPSAAELIHLGMDTSVNEIVVAVLRPGVEVLAATLSAHGSATFDVHVLAGLDGDAVGVAAGQALPLSRLVRRWASASMASSSSASILACRPAACWAR